ncbi:MAG: hypothetical protein LBT74_01825 [Acidobacteriota bacterium]|jgi:hypothetical protein|nr:hypothetical protein [Acidobacteriota bacterium]
MGHHNGRRGRRPFAVALLAIFSIAGGIGAFAQGQVEEQAEPSGSDAAFEPDGFADIAESEFEDVRADFFARIDADESGKIEVAEWPGRKKAFRLLDVNRDGGVTFVEFQSRKARFWNQVFENIDLDGNRMITRDEWMDVSSGFDRLDRDKNGIIDRSEFYSPR